MIVNALRLASAARLLAYAAALTALVPLSRCRAAAPEARPLDPDRDPRLARRMVLRCEETPISGVLRRI